MTRQINRRIAGWMVAALAVGLPTAAVEAQDVKLPQNILDAKALKVGLQNQYAPLNFVDPKTKELTGFNVDLFNALAPKLGVDVQMVVDTFPSLLPSLDTGRSDLMGAGIFDSAPRREKYTFVDYLTSGPVFVTASANAGQFTRGGDVCGKTVGYPRNVASFKTVLDEFNKTECTGKGKPDIKPVSDDLPAQLGIAQNRYEVALMAQEAVLYLEQSQPNTLQKIGEPLHSWLFGIAFKKDDIQLRDAVAAAIDASIKDGTYSKILAKYNMTSMGVTQTAIDKGEY